MGEAKFRKFEVLFEALGESLADSWRTTMRELLELLIVLAAEMSDSEEAQSLRMRAQALGLDTSPLIVHEDDDTDGVVEPTTAPRKQPPKPREHTARSSYQRDRLDDLLRECVAMGIGSAKAKFMVGRVEIIGKHPSKGEVHLRWLRSSMGEGEALCTKLNEEIRRFNVGDPATEAVR